ncbi:transcriptional regulator, CdaR family [Pseudonocardia thermophila]|jgi:Regulator of polyketide synthase expression|uniref:Transcriptional regulator, CdaR family n=1 Tax=Pseudonocardia thermophila TaxID=1848 RepID=A0A1M6WNH9_PSETH|nr:helix-turn-helix domain-containing protein [Pseudonocardia thermophila]SHK95241.1 transcriptional regulator, CdaR family [Pseudonocardia thermophila]
METSLRRLLGALGTPLAEALSTPDGLDVPVSGLAIVDPDDEPDDYAGRFVLVIGARGREAVHAVRGVDRRGAVAVAVKIGASDPDLLRDATRRAAVVAVRDDARWDHVEQLLREVLETDAGPDELFSLAQTTALLTGGLVSIEDTGSRVLAYSRYDSASADELRRLSVLGWQGPADYLGLLREWGVFDRVRAGEGVVRIDEHPELGIRRRLAAGIHAGARWLGTIWVQEGSTGFTPRAEEALLGATRVAAQHLVRRRTRRSPGTDLVAGLLAGRVAPELVAGVYGIDPEAPVVVAAFTAPGADAVGVAELADVVAVHAATYRRTAPTAVDGDRVYAVLPGVPADGIEPGLRAMCAEVVALAGRRTGSPVRSGIGAPAPRLGGAAVSRAEADRVLATMPADADVATLPDLRAEILLDETLDLLAAAPEVRDPAVERLLAHDAEHGSDLAGSVLTWLDAHGDVRMAAERLVVHPNTLRHRLRRATAVSGLALGDPRARLMAHLQLLLAFRTTQRH